MIGKILLFIVMFVLTGVSVAFAETSKPFLLNYYIPDLQPYYEYTIQEMIRWFVVNAGFLWFAYAAFDWMQKQAIKIEAVKGNTRMEFVGHYLVIFFGYMKYIVKGSWIPTKDKVQEVITSIKEEPKQ